MKSEDEFFMIIGLENDIVKISGFANVRDLPQNPPLRIKIGDFQTFLDTEASEYKQVR